MQYRGRPSGGYSAVHLGAEYGAEELEFLRAVDAYRRRHGRPFPAYSELLEILRSLGWRKVGPGAGRRAGAAGRRRAAARRT